MKTIYNKLFVIILIAASAGCKKGYLDVNQDPNRVTDDNITAQLIFPQAAHATGARSASGNFQFIENWMGYWSASGDFAIQQDETSYNIDFTFGDPLWQNQYNVLFDLYQVKLKAQDKGDSLLAGASMVLSAKLFQDLVDLFGNIPYSQAFQNSKYTQPAYDNAADVYAALQKSLDSAIIYLGQAPRTSFTNVDIVNGGNTSLWIKFANTLKLRMLIRQSQMASFNPAAEVAKIKAKGGVLHAGESIDVNPGYVNSAAKQSPFYANYGLTPTGAEASTVTRANVYFVSLLNSTSDPRLPRFSNHRLMAALSPAQLMVRRQVTPMAPPALAWAPDWQEALRRTNGSIHHLKVCSWKPKALPVAGTWAAVMLKQHMRMP